MKAILTHLQQSFASWQASSSTKRHSNADLKEQAVKCLEHYTKKEVSEAIGVSTETLRSWQRSLNCNQKAATHSPTFVEMKLNQSKDTNETNHVPLSLQITLSNSIVIQIKSTSIELSATFIVVLNKESQRCSI